MKKICVFLASIMMLIGMTGILTACGKPKGGDIMTLAEYKAVADAFIADKTKNINARTVATLAVNADAGILSEFNFRLDCENEGMLMSLVIDGLLVLEEINGQPYQMITYDNTGKAEMIYKWENNTWKETDYTNDAVNLTDVVSEFASYLNTDLYTESKTSSKNQYTLKDNTGLAEHVKDVEIETDNEKLDMTITYETEVQNWVFKIGGQNLTKPVIS